MQASTMDGTAAAEGMINMLSPLDTLSKEVRMATYYGHIVPATKESEQKDKRIDNPVNLYSEIVHSV